MSASRIIGMIIAILLCAGGTPFFISGQYFSGVIDHLKNDEPLRMSLDFSKTGEYTGDLTLLINPPHGEDVRLITTPSFSGPLDGLEGHLKVETRSGQKTFEYDLTAKMMGERLHFPIFEKGEYRVVLTVVKPAPAIAGHAQVWVARHIDCGLDGLNVVIGFGIAGLCWLIALALGSWSFWPRKRQG